MAEENATQEIVDDMMTDPDKDAERKPAPVPPQTIEAETGPADDHGDER